VEAASLAGGARLWQAPWRHTTAAVLVTGRLEPARLLAALRSAGVRHLDVVVLTSAAPTQAAALRAVLRRHDATLVWAPPGAPLAEAVTPAAGQSVRAGPFEVRVVRAGARLEVEVGRARGPPGACG